MIKLLQGRLDAAKYIVQTFFPEQVEKYHIYSSTYKCRYIK